MKTPVREDSMEKIIVFGAGGHAKVVIDVIERQAKYSIGFVYDTDPTKKNIMGYPILHDFERLKEQGLFQGIIAVGHNWSRSQLRQRIDVQLPGFSYVTAIHPNTSIGRNVKIGVGTVIMSGCCINSETHIGSHCIINTCTSLDHENIVEDFGNVSPGVTTGGKVKIGEYCFIGLGVNIIQKTNVGAHSVIGAGSLVIKELKDKVLAYGTPCKVIRPISIGDNFV
jgi:sugar O-acyltransferase (sialic acid O-acetyltransferase NeuD family)